MKFLIIQLSEIHFSEGEYSVLDKQENLFNSVKNSRKDFDMLFVFITASSAYSGKGSPFDIMR
jgi:hypothetical protein